MRLYASAGGQPTGDHVMFTFVLDTQAANT
jgi:hypothetical protein